MAGNREIPQQEKKQKLTDSQREEIKKLTDRINQLRAERDKLDRTMQKKMDDLVQQHQDQLQALLARENETITQLETNYAITRENNERHLSEIKLENETLKVFLDLNHTITGIVSGEKNINDESVITEFKEKINKAIPYFETSPDAAKNMVRLLALELYEHMPKPENDTSAYANFFHQVIAMRNMILLANRFEIPGIACLPDQEFKLEGLTATGMLKSMIRSFQDYVDLDSALSDLSQSNGFDTFTKEDLVQIVKLVANDINHTALTTNANIPDDAGIHIPIRLHQHWTCISMSGDKLLFADKSRSNNPGIEIYTCDDPEKLNALQQSLIERASKANRYISTKPLANSSEELANELVRDYGIKKTNFIPLSEQYAGTCAWSSCSKSLLLNALYLRFFDSTINHGKSPKEAHNIAEKYARKIRKSWSTYDKSNLLQNYLRHLDHNDTTKKLYDPSLLARIKVKTEQRKKYDTVNDLLSGRVSESEHVKAKERLYIASKRLILEHYPILGNIFKEHLDTIVAKITDLYLIVGKNKLEENLTNLLREGSTSSAIKYLDDAIREAKPAPSLLSRHSMLSSQNTHHSKYNNNDEDNSIKEKPSP